MRTRIPAWCLLFVPILVGTVIMARGGAPTSRWGLHVAAAVLGILAFAAIRTVPGWLARWASPVAVAAGIAVVAATFLEPGIEGVRRWHELGPLRVHASALLVPALLVFAAAQLATRPLVAYLVLAGVQVVHVLQPDAGQATAFGVAAIVCATAARSLAARVGLGALYTASIVAAWMRPDPLPPAPFVEDIVARAFAIGPVLGVVAVLSLVPLVLAPWLRGRDGARGPEHTRREVMLTVYFAGSAIVPVFGEFPVPLLGFGPSPVVGAFLGLAALQWLRDHDARAAAEERRDTRAAEGDRDDGPRKSLVQSVGA